MYTADCAGRRMGGGPGTYPPSRILTDLPLRWPRPLDSDVWTWIPRRASYRELLDRIQQRFASDAWTEGLLSHHQHRVSEVQGGPTPMPAQPRPRCAVS